MDSPQMIGTATPVPPPLVMTTRIVWGAIIMGQLCFAGVILLLQQNGSLHQTPIPLNLMIPIDAIMLVTAIGMTLLVPRLFKGSTNDETARRRQYTISNILPLACLDAASFFGLVIVMLSTHWWPAGIVPLVSIAFQLLRFPRAIVRVS